MDTPKGDGSSSVVARADALMQRRRQAADAHSEASEPLPVLVEVVDPDDNLPVLTVVDEGHPPVPAIDPAVIDQLARDLTRRVRQRVVAELPTLVEASLQSILPGLTRDLLEGIDETARGAIHDFLSERDGLGKRSQKR